MKLLFILFGLFRYCISSRNGTVNKDLFFFLNNENNSFFIPQFYIYGDLFNNEIISSTNNSLTFKLNDSEISLNYSFISFSFRNPLLNCNLIVNQNDTNPTQILTFNISEFNRINITINSPSSNDQPHEFTLKNTNVKYFLIQHQLVDHASLFGNLYVFLGCVTSIYGSFKFKETFIIYFIIFTFTLIVDITEFFPKLETENTLILTMFSSIIMGGMFGYLLSNKLKILKVFNGFCFGISIFRFIEGNIFGIFDYHNYSLLLNYLLLSLFGILGGISWLIMKKNSITFIISSSVVGTYLMIRGFNFILGGIYYENLRPILKQEGGDYHMNIVYIVAFVIWFSFSFTVQMLLRGFKNTAKDICKKFKLDAKMSSLSQVKILEKNLNPVMEKSSEEKGEEENIRELTISTVINELDNGERELQIEDERDNEKYLEDD